MTAYLNLPAADTIDLAGSWHVQIDPSNVGRTEHWQTRAFSTPIALPGSLQENRMGDPVTVATKWTGDIIDRSWFTAPQYAPYREPGNVKVPFWLQPETHYTNPAWYQREIEIPASWQGTRLTLSLERPHWKTTAWLDERELGSNDALSVAHVYELGLNVAPGRHRLTIRVDNSFDPDLGVNSHSASDHTQGNWNGIVGRIELRASAPVWAEDLEVTVNPARTTVHVRGVLRNATGRQASGQIAFAVEPGASADPVTGQPGSVSFAAAADREPFELDLHPGSVLRAWDEFSPAVYRLQVNVSGAIGDAAFTGQQSVAFGARIVGTAGRQLLINGRPLFLRGTLDCAAFPRTGHPPTDVAAWKQEFATIQAHGLNHVRFHSWCPPEAAFTAADELGLYLQVEVASWPNQSTTLGDGKPVDAWINAETARILRVYGNHPSFIALCACNEPAGPNHEAWLGRWITTHKAIDGRRLYTAGAGWPEIAENDYHVRSEPRIQHWGEGLASRINHVAPETRSDYRDFINERTVPIVSHEIGQWCVYPNFGEMPKYTGYLKPRNFEIFRASLEAHGLGAQAHDFLIASGKLQALCYKEDIESALRTPSMAGFQLLGLNDFPGQGTALVGVLDAFWEEKGYITPAAFHRFASSTVPLARLDKRVFTTDDHLVADVEVTHFGASPLPDATAHWSLINDAGQAVAEGRFDHRDVAVGAAQPLGRVDLPLARISAPARYRFTVTIEPTGTNGKSLSSRRAELAEAGRPRSVTPAGSDAPKISNDWDVWVYPQAARVTAPAPASVMIAQRWDAAAQAKLAAGGTVWLMLAPEHVAPDAGGHPVALGFSSIFWNTAWTSGQAPHTLGILCDPMHAAFTSFPTEAHSNWQWWYVITQSAAMILDGLPRELRPTVQVIDDWVTNRKLGLAFEANVGNGRLLVTSIDFADAVLDPVRRQLRASLLAYVSGSQFRPATSVAAADLAQLVKP